MPATPQRFHPPTTGEYRRIVQLQALMGYNRRFGLETAFRWVRANKARIIIRALMVNCYGLV